MNRAIRGTFALFVVLFALLVVFTSRWSVFEAEGLKDQTANRRELLEDQQIPRGLILARDGARIVENRKLGSGNTTRYERRYPMGPLFGHPVGYAFISKGSAGLEKSQNDFLSSRESEFATLFEKLQGTREEGDNVRTTLDVGAQRVAAQALAGRRGSVVALEPATGRIRVMVSTPEYDPNQIPSQFAAFNRDPGSPLLNRATQSRYPPGSTFKVVTAAAALDSGRYRPESMIDGRNNKRISGLPLQNFGGQEFGMVSFTDALTNSVNTAFAEIGENVGRETLVRYMKRFGFYSEPPLDYPENALAASGIVSKGKLVEAGAGFDAGRVAIGQGGNEGQALATPLQMAMVAAAVGNDGELMTPRLVDRVTGQDGRVRDQRSPREMSQVMKASSARALGGMMRNVVDRGTGTPAQLQGVPVAGKTGTAELGDTNQAWFITFAPADNPRIAMAVTVEKTAGTGGEEAAPIARQVLEHILNAKGAGGESAAAGGF